jgi:hypothetical protein
MSARLSGSPLNRPGSDDMKTNIMKMRFKLNAKGSERLMKRMEALARKPAAKSSAHEGVVARPMDRGLSTSLALKRAQMLDRGTSVKRLSKHADEEEEELRKKEQEEEEAALLKGGDLVEETEDLLPKGEKEAMVQPKAERGTSVARTKSVYTEAPIVRAPTGTMNKLKIKKEEDDVQDLPI